MQRLGKWHGKKGLIEVLILSAIQWSVKVERRETFEN